MVKKIFSIVLVLSVVGMVLGGCKKDEAAEGETAPTTEGAGATEEAK